jgi:hypothetical protein
MTKYRWVACALGTEEEFVLARVGAVQPAEAEDLEHARRCAHARDVDRIATAREGVSEVPERRHRLDRVRLFLPVEIVSGATRSRLPLGFCSHSTTRREGSSYGSWFNSTALMTLKIAVLAPMPATRIRIATAVKVGWRLSDRHAYRTSRSRSPIRPPLWMSNPTSSIYSLPQIKLCATSFHLTFPVMIFAPRTSHRGVPSVRVSSRTMKMALSNSGVAVRVLPKHARSPGGETVLFS